MDEVREREKVWFIKFTSLMFLTSIILEWHSVNADR